jgi:hypothetical protein
MPPVGFEPIILISERPQTHALDRAATGIGPASSIYIIYERGSHNAIWQAAGWRPVM